MGGRDLVPANDHAVREAGGDFRGLGCGESHGAFPRRLPGDFRLIDLRPMGAEGQAKSFQQGSAVTRGRRQDQGA